MIPDSRPSAPVPCDRIEMNFDCPACQAKYQIADEKVATKSVKMKCRKCETALLISSLGARRALSSSRGKAVSMPPGMSVAPGMSIPPVSIPLRRPVGPAIPPPPRGQSLPPQSLKAPGSPSLPARPAPISARSVPGVSHGPLPADAGALAVQIRELEAQEPAPPSLRRVASRIPTEAWHVGVGGKIEGPVSRAELRKWLADGTIDKDTLAWKDGMSGWAAMGSITDLSDLLDASGPATATDALPPPGLVVPARLEFEPQAAPTAIKIQEAPEPAPMNPMPQGAFSPSIAPVRGLGAATPPRRDSIWERAHIRPPKKSHIVFAVVAAAAFGIAMGFVFFGGQEVKIVEKIVEVKVKDASRSVDDVPPPPGVENEVVEAPKIGSAKGPAGTKTVTAPSDPASGKAAAPLKGLSGLNGLSAAGPQVGPSSNPGAGATQALDGAQIESTVSRYRTGVKRSCWQPALDARDKNAPSSARVTATITVLGSGAVKGVTTSGDPQGYRGLASCIQSRVATWTFPASNGTTTVNVPFVFAAQ